MLSTRQAHHILQLSERHGAKIVFAGDTQQQQPVEAGPGLRLIRDTVGSVRVDRIRRQKADLEDILTHIQGETPETARLMASSMEEERRTRILNYYENMKGKPVFTPWQVAAAEALRDGDAASAISAFHLRGRFHIGYDEEKTLTGLVDDWDRYQREHPDKSSVVLACTRAEVRALSYLMRERRFASPCRMGNGPIWTGCGPGNRQQGHGRRTDDFATRDRARRPVAHRRHALGEAAVQRHRGHGRGLQG